MSNTKRCPACNRDTMHMVHEFTKDEPHYYCMFCKLILDPVAYRDIMANLDAKDKEIAALRAIVEKVQGDGERMFVEARREWNPKGDAIRAGKYVLCIQGDTTKEECEKYLGIIRIPGRKA